MSEDNNEDRPIPDDDSQDEPKIEISMRSIEFDGSIEGLKEQLSDMPEEVKEQVMERLAEVIDLEADKRLKKVNSQLDKYADDFRQVLAGEMDDEVRALSYPEAVGSFTHWLAEHSDLTRSSMAVLLGVAVGRVAEYQDKVLDLELKLAGHAS